MKLTPGELMRRSFVKHVYHPDDYEDLINYRLDLIKLSTHLPTMIKATMKRFIPTKVPKITNKDNPVIFYHYLYLCAKMVKDKEVIKVLEEIPHFYEIIELRNKNILNEIDPIKNEMEILKLFNINLDIDNFIYPIINLMTFIKMYNENFIYKKKILLMNKNMLTILEFMELKKVISISDIEMKDNLLKKLKTFVK